jgi:hypothetical protein
MCTPFISNAVYAIPENSLTRISHQAAREDCGDELREYNIDHEVYDPGGGFDPAFDSIVRVESPIACAQS